MKVSAPRLPRRDTRCSCEWLLNHAIKVLPEWPAHSLDLNPIEHMWALLKRKNAGGPPRYLVLEKESAGYS